MQRVERIAFTLLIAGILAALIVLALMLSPSAENARGDSGGRDPGALRERRPVRMNLNHHNLPKVYAPTPPQRPRAAKSVIPPARTGTTRGPMRRIEHESESH